MSDREVAVIVGTGPGLSASLARLFAKEGMAVAVAARNTDKLADLAAETGARTYACDAVDAAAVDGLFDAVTTDLGTPNLVVYNASRRVRGPFVEVDPAEVQAAIMTTGFGAFVVGQAAAKRMLEAGSGTILFTGASAGMKGFPHSAAFAMGKFAQAGLVESMARELQPENIHVAEIAIDGGIHTAERAQAMSDRGPDALLMPDAIAETYLHIHRQHRSAWTSFVALRPWVEKF
jgi:NAD(P)-dependent dehydrogenase (short-subunit alcohol dehydrogenase family)